MSLCAGTTAVAWDGMGEKVRMREDGMVGERTSMHAYHHLVEARGYHVICKALFFRFLALFLHKVIKVLVVLVAIVPGINRSGDLGGGSERGLSATLLLGLQCLLGSLLLLVGKSSQGAGILAHINIADSLGELAEETLEERGIETLFLK